MKKIFTSFILLLLCGCRSTSLVSLLKTGNRAAITKITKMPSTLNDKLPVRLTLKGDEVVREWPPLFIASWYGHSEVVSDLLEFEELQEVPQDAFLGSPLSWEIKHGHTRNAISLARRGWYLTSVVMDGEGFTGNPLQLASAMGNTKVVEALLRAGVPVDLCYPSMKARWYGMCTPLQLACEFGSKETMEILIRAGADVNKRLLYGNEQQLGPSVFSFAIKAGGTDKLSFLLNAGVNKASAIDAAYECVNSNNIEALNVLVTNGYELDAPNCEGTTALGLALYQGDRESVSLLLKAGASLRKCDRTGWYTACFSDNTNELGLELFDFVMKTRLSLGISEECGVADQAALFESILHNRLDFVNYLLGIGVSANKPIQGMALKGLGNDPVPLFVAVHANRPSIVQYLMNRGADVNITDENGKTASMIAQEKGYVDIVRLLNRKSERR